ncbi:MAG: FtsH protease activity modulator HflK [Calditrichaeota bacterium]|jgi:modulator of FtsH protease HflK|nr:FtsH protease activity modulator HflK [Calditrichota bacterium]MBT7617975.1 FtsH protease activity modulator HflK [Calditrichota bacterium]MBT7787421.1 FtsH protease activity modulator HflK [Calditrichota bacterium]
MAKRRIIIGDEQIEIPDFSRFLGKGVWSILGIVALLWLASGLYIVKPDQQGIIRRFGQYNKTTSPGIHWRIPYPVDRVDKPRVKQYKRAEIGFRTIDHGPPARYSDRPLESLMLTGNLNIIDCDMIVQYRIVDPVKYLYRVRDLETTVRLAAEAALRQVIGKHDIDEALTSGKSTIQIETMENLQEILDLYETGLTVVQVQLQEVHPPEAVKDAFKDVASAREDLNKLINQAQGYQNDVIPRARGMAAKVEKDAQAWASERVTMADGDSQNFLKILKQYTKAKSVTRKRLLLETMEEILPGVQLYILKGDKNGSLMNVIGLPEVGSKTGGRR